jgi:hypothetical protein
MRTLFCVFFTFIDLYGVKLTCHFWSVIFLSGEAPWDLAANLDVPEAQKRPGGTPKHLGRATCTVLAIDHPNRVIFSSIDIF